MQRHLWGLCLLLLSVCATHCKSGLVTMSNNCYDLLNKGQALNKEGSYNAALESFNSVLKKCDAYDAKEKALAGKAAALNGLHHYGEAMDAANQGLKIDGSGIDNLFERAGAEMGLGMDAAARTDFATIVSLTAKNRNTAERATIYAKIAEADARQQKYPDALQSLQQAIDLDPSNLHFYMQRGDINVASGNLSAALGNYDEAISKGKNDAEAWKARTTTLVKSYQQKYNTDNAEALSRKISKADRQSLCNSIQTSQQRGVKDVGFDLLQAGVCQ